MTTKTVIEILEELESTPGSLAKRDILEAHRKNDLLKQVFVAAQDLYVVYYINKVKMPKALSENPDDVVLKDFFSVVLPELSSRRMTGNNAKMWTEQAFSRMSSLQQKWCLRILLHNLRCGVQESTVNKVWPGTLKSFAVALACTLKSEFVRGEGIKILEPVTYPVRVEPKLDGLRCIAMKQKGVVTLYTRNGSPLETLPIIVTELESAPYDNIVLDGEGLAASNDWNTSVSVMMARKTMHDDADMVYNVFDAVPLADWTSQRCDLPYSERCKLVAQIVEGMHSIKQVPHVTAKDEKELLAAFSKAMDDKFEGVMLKTMNTPYIFKRSENIMKLKPCVTYEGVIVGHYEGRRGTKREGSFGGFEVMLPNGIVTRVGGGFNDAMRAQVQLDGPDSWCGRIVEAEAQPDPQTSDGLSKDGKMRFPVYIRERSVEDVDEAVRALQAAWKRSQ